jgi:hypothetical protein
MFVDPNKILSLKKDTIMGLWFMIGISGVPWAGFIAISNRGSMIKTE